MTCWAALRHRRFKLILAQATLAQEFKPSSVGNSGFAHVMFQRWCVPSKTLKGSDGSFQRCNSGRTCGLRGERVLSEAWGSPTPSSCRATMRPSTIQCEVWTHTETIEPVCSMRHGWCRSASLAAEDAEWAIPKQRSLSSPVVPLGMRKQSTSCVDMVVKSIEVVLRKFLIIQRSRITVKFIQRRSQCGAAVSHHSEESPLKFRRCCLLTR